MTDTELLAVIGGRELVPVDSGPKPIVPAVRLSVRAATSEILERHYDWLSRICFVEFKDPTEALDCLQEVLLEIAKSVPSFDGRSELRTWMFVVAKRTAYRFRTRLQRRETRFPLGPKEDVQQTAIESPSGPMNAERALIVSEEHERMLEHVRKLPEKQRWAVVFHYFEDLGVESVAERLGCSVGAVKTHLFRARNSLKKMIEKENDEQNG